MEINPHLGVDADTLFRQNKKFIERLARKYSKNLKSSMIEPADIFSVASIGFIKAYERFDPTYIQHDKDITKGFLSYCSTTISGEIKRFFRDKARIIRPSRGISELSTSIKKHDLMGKKPDEILDALQGKMYNNKVITLQDVEEALKYMATEHVYSAERTMGGDGDDKETTLGETIAFSSQADYSHIFVEEFINSLDERDRGVLKLRMEQLGQKEIGNKVGVSQMHVSRLLRRIGERLDKYMHGEDGPVIVQKPRGKQETRRKKEMGRQSKVTKEQKDKAIKLLKFSTMTYQQIADETGLTQGYVSVLGGKQRPEKLRKAMATKNIEKKAQLLKEAGFGKEAEELLKKVEQAAVAQGVETPKPMEEKNDVKEVIAPPHLTLKEAIDDLREEIREEVKQEMATASKAPETSKGKIKRKTVVNYNGEGTGVEGKEMILELEALIEMLKDTGSDDIDFSIVLSAK